MNTFRHASVTMPYAWHHPVSALEKSLTTHRMLFDSALETVLTIVLLILVAVAFYLLMEAWYLYQIIPPDGFV
jgi:hypothetical protein